MGEPSQTPSTNPDNPPTSNREEQSSSAGSTTRREKARASRETTSTSGTRCEVLKDSCKNPAEFKVTFPSESVTYCCAEHKQTVVDNYPDQELVFEEV